MVELHMSLCVRTCSHSRKDSGTINCSVILCFNIPKVYIGQNPEISPYVQPSMFDTNACSGPTSASRWLISAQQIYLTTAALIAAAFAPTANAEGCYNGGYV
jgi:hypothetical protein